MAKWEYAAIVKTGTKPKYQNWCIVKPGKASEYPTLTAPPGGPYEGTQETPVQKYYWQFDDNDEENFKTSKNRRKGWSVKGLSRQILFEDADLLKLINTASAEGWEITGGIGMADHPHETRYRMMRREL